MACIGLLSMRPVYRTAAGGAEIYVKDYFRISVYYPTLDNIVSDVELRFGPTQRKAANKLARLVPRFDYNWNY